VTRFIRRSRTPRCFRIEVRRGQGTVEEQDRPVALAAGKLLKEMVCILDTANGPHTPNLMTQVAGMGRNDADRLVFRRAFPVEFAKEGVRGLQTADEHQRLTHRGSSSEKRGKGLGQGFLMDGPTQHQQSAEQTDVERPGQEEYRARKGRSSVEHKDGEQQGQGNQGRAAGHHEHIVQRREAP
jgi:hypothetical protein